MTETMTWDAFEELTKPLPRPSSIAGRIADLQPGVPSRWGVYATQKQASDRGRAVTKTAARQGVTGLLWGMRRAEGRYEMWIGLPPNQARGCACDGGLVEPYCPKHDPPEDNRRIVLDTTGLTDGATSSVPVTLDTPRTPEPAKGNERVPPVGRNQPSAAGIADARRRPLAEPRPEAPPEVKGPHMGRHRPPESAVGYAGAKSKCEKCDVPLVFEQGGWRADAGASFTTPPARDGDGNPAEPCTMINCRGFFRQVAHSPLGSMKCDVCGTMVEP